MQGKVQLLWASTCGNTPTNTEATKKPASASTWTRGFNCIDWDAVASALPGLRDACSRTRDPGGGQVLKKVAMQDLTPLRRLRPQAASFCGLLDVAVGTRTGDRPVATIVVKFHVLPPRRFTFKRLGQVSRSRKVSRSGTHRNASLLFEVLVAQTRRRRDQADRRTIHRVLVHDRRGRIQAHVLKRHRDAGRARVGDIDRLRDTLLALDRHVQLVRPRRDLRPWVKGDTPRYLRSTTTDAPGRSVSTARRRPGLQALQGPEVPRRASSLRCRRAPRYLLAPRLRAGAGAARGAAGATDARAREHRHGTCAVRCCHTPCEQDQRDGRADPYRHAEAAASGLV